MYILIIAKIIMHSVIIKLDANVGQKNVFPSFVFFIHNFLYQSNLVHLNFSNIAFEVSINLQDRVLFNFA